jgi:hypothetical protein
VISRLPGLFDLPPGPPPHNLEAERAVLGGILLDPALLTRAVEAGLLPDQFHKDGHRQVFEAMTRLFKRGEPADTLMVAEELRRVGELEDAGGQAALATLMEDATVATQFGSYVGLVIHHAQKRTIAQACHTAAMAAMDGGEPGDIIGALRRQLAHIEEANQPSGTRPAWRLFDASDEWDFPPIQELIEGLLPLKGVVWWGGLPKRYKSLLLLYLCLAIARRRAEVVKKFKVSAYPNVAYVAREDGGSRLQERINDILAAWGGGRPEPGAIRFLIRPSLDLLNASHVTELRDICLRDRIGVIVLDTWTALSPTADPLSANDQAALAVVVVKLCEETGGLVIVVDHSRKNRPEGRALSSADIFGPPQKWAAAEHIVMLDLTSDGRRLEVFTESKDLDGTRFFLEISPRGSGREKFVYAGAVAEIADARRALGNLNRAAVLQVLQTTDSALSTPQIALRLKAAGIALGEDAVLGHTKALVNAKMVRQTGEGKARRYWALELAPITPSSEKAGPADE